VKRRQAKERMTRLEESITQAQNREGQILDMTQWMTEMNDLLQSRLDADIVAGDVPDEYEVASDDDAADVFVDVIDGVVWPGGLLVCECQSLDNPGHLTYKAN